MGTSISAIIQVTTPPLGVAPGPMAAPVVSGVTSTSLTLTWVAPATGDPPIVYQVQQSLQSPTSFSNVGGPISGLALTVTGLTPATGYEFQVVASNATGSSTSPVALATTLAILPGAPTGLAVVGSPGTTDVSLTWVAPVTGTRPLTYTILSRTPSGSGSFVAGPTTSNTALDFTGLVSGASYDFQVTATNTVGTGPVSGTVSATTATTAVIPTAPQNPTVGTVAQTSVQVSWTTPLSGTPPLNYVLQFRTPPGVGTFTSRPSTSSLTDTATGLIGSTSYQFQVLATNSVGTGPASAQVSATTLAPPPVLPTAPTGLTSTAVTTTSVSLTWTAPTTGTLPLTYQPQWSPAGAGTWTNGTPTTSTSGQITGLTPGTLYDFRVNASNAAGAGPFSATFTTTTTAQLPAAPTNLAVGTVTQSSVQVSWTAPSTGTPPFSYVLQWSPHNAGTFTNVAIASGVTTGTVTGLSASTAYDFQVKAVNSAGTGPASAIASSTTLAPPPVLPSAPTGLAFVSSTTASVTFSWSAPTTGTTPFTYQTQWSPIGANSWTNGPAPSVATAQVTGLAAGTTYDFRVQALNTAGSGPFSSPLTSSTAAAVVAITWNPNKISGITLSADLLTATATGSSTPYSLNQGVLATASNSSGQHWFQVTMSTLTPNYSVGLADSSVVLTTDSGFNPDSVVFFPSTAAVNEQPAQSAYYNGSPILTPSGVPAADTAGHVITVCVDFAGARWWVQTPAMVTFYGANAWNDSATAVPGVGAAGVGGIPTSVTGALFPAFMTAEGGGVAVLNATSTPLGSVVIPTSFSSWGGITQTTTAPNAVTGLTAGTPTDVTVPLSWTQPTIGSQPLTYTMQFQPASGGNVAKTTTSFLASMGINTHLEFNDGAYANFNACVTALQFLGIKKIRDGVPDPTGGSPYTNYVNALNAIGAAGMSATLFVHPPNSIATCLTEIANREIAHPGMINAIEGPNETNNFPITFNSQTSPAADVPYQTALYSAVKAHGTLGSKPVYYYTGLYTTSTLSGKADYANGHPYPNNGDQPSPRLDSEYTDHFVSPLVLGNYLRVGTETGYSTIGGVDQATQMKNTLNLYLDAFRQGLAEIYPYQLLHDRLPGNNDQGFGFFNVDFTPKQVATGVHNLTTILADAGGAFTPGSLTYTLTGMPPLGKSMLLQKSTGVFELCVWAETADWSNAGAAEIAVPPVTVTVTFGAAMQTVSVYDPTVAATAQQTFSNATSVQVGVADHPLVLEITPAWLTSGTSQVTSGTVAGLTQQTSYNFRVNAANSGGTGGFSNVVSARTLTTGVLPGAPTAVSVGSATSNSLVVTWQPPTTGSASTGYQVQYKPSSSNTFLNAPTVPTSSIPLGLYAGVPGDGATGLYPGFDVQWDGFTSTMGRAATVCTSFMNSDRSPTDSTFGWASQASFYSGQLRGNARTVNTIPSIAWPFGYDPGTGNVGVAAAIAAGTHDALIQTCLGNWKANGFSTLYLRPSWEFNLPNQWAVPTVNTLANFLAAFQHFYTVVHNYAAANTMTIKVIWNPNVGNNQNSVGLTVTQQYPGDSFVDVLGIDTYGAPVDGGHDPTATTTDVTQYFVQTMFNMAVSKSKTVAFCEVGGIDTTFATQMSTAINARASGVTIEFFAHFELDDSSGNLSWTNASDNQATLAGIWRNLFSSTTSQTISGLASSTTYNFQVDAFNAQGSGAFSSPVASGTTLSGAPTNTNVLLTQPTGRTLSKYMFGFATGALGDNSFLFAADATAKTSMAVIRPTLLRVNSQLQIIEQWASGNTGVMNNFWNNAASFMDPTYRLVMGCGPTFNDTSVSPATRATNTANFASAMRSQGHEIFYWEVGNECQGMGVSAYNGYFNAIYDALKGVNSSYIIGGPTADWWNDIDLNSWASGIGGRTPGFCSIHSYPVGPATSTAQCYINMSGFGDVDSTRSSLEGHGNTAGIPIGTLEYNMDGNPGEDSRQGTYVGAVHIALQLVRSFRGTGTNVPNFQMGGMWDIIQDSNYGAVGNSSSSGNNAVISPQGYYLGKAGQVMAGTEVSTNTTIGSLQILATKSGSTFAIQLINYSTTSAATANITLSGGSVSGSIARWEIGKSNQTTPATSTQASLSSVSVPSEQIVILTGSFV